MGLSACQAMRQNNGEAFTGKDQFGYLTQTQFQDVTGEVVLDATIGSRTFNSTTYKLVNLVEDLVLDADSNAMLHFNGTVTDVCEEGSIQDLSHHAQCREIPKSESHCFPDVEADCNSFILLCECHPADIQWATSKRNTSEDDSPESIVRLSCPTSWQESQDSECTGGRILTTKSAGELAKVVQRLERLLDAKDAEIRMLKHQRDEASLPTCPERFEDHSQTIPDETVKLEDIVVDTLYSSGVEKLNIQMSLELDEENPDKILRLKSLYFFH
ncbi:hypothetical protein IV203_025254 [Nitzschia inconspicua]|nr:hypothetical protein IV203_025254 [Nitzschia inconspicua]